MKRFRSPEDKRAEDASSNAWMNRHNITALGVDDVTAARVAKQVQKEESMKNKVPRDSGIRSFTDIIPQEETDALYALHDEAERAATETFPDLTSRKMGRTVIEVANVAQAPEPINVHVDNKAS